VIDDFFGASETSLFADVTPDPAAEIGAPAGFSAVYAYAALTPITFYLPVPARTIFAQFGTLREAVYSTGHFLAGYEGSSVAAVGDGQRFVVTRANGWPGGEIVFATLVTLDGSDVQDSVTWGHPDAVGPPGSVAANAEDHVSAALSRLVLQLR
jgi:hypothetical protein